MTQLKNSSLNTRHVIHIYLNQNEVRCEAISPYWPKTFVQNTQDRLNNTALINENKTADKSIG